jgi:CheY-like chemotaxis protein
VADTGSGIAQEDLERLFDPFFSRKFTGRGLGLPIVLGILRSHRGAVTVESQLHQGSTFRIYFPLASDEVRHPPPHAAEHRAIGGGTVLLVDDEEMVRKLCKTALTSLGFNVVLAKDGAEAVEIFRQHQDEIRCVLCDLTMPGMDGWETLAALRKLAPGIPAILASGYDKAHVLDGDHRELPQAFLSKPFQFQGLREAIGRALADGTRT